MKKKISDVFEGPESSLRKAFDEVCAAKEAMSPLPSPIAHHPTPDTIERLVEEVERLRVQLAGCSVAALGWAKGEQDRKEGDYGWSASFSDVKKLREKYENARNETIGKVVEDYTNWLILNVGTKQLLTNKEKE